MEEIVNIALKICLGAVTLPFFAVGCSNTPPAEHPVETALAHPIATVETKSASSSIAEARCAREDRCENVGNDKKYSSTQDCLNRIKADWADDLNARECPGGVNDDQLDECLKEVRHEECSSPFDTLSRIAECTASQICKS
jgi:hypothetical protein